MMKADNIMKDKLYDEGISLIRSNDMEGAKRKYIEALNYVTNGLSPEEREAKAKIISMIGVIEMFKAHFGTAYDLFNECIRLCPTNSQHWMHYSQANARLGIKENAVLFCRKAIELDPKNRMAHEAMGMICKEQKNYEGAVYSFHEAWKLENSARNAHFIADIYQWSGHNALANVWYDKTFELDPNYYDAHFSIAFFKMKTFDVKAAAYHAEKGCLSPINGQLSRYNLSLLQLTLGDLKNGWEGHEMRLKFKETDSESSIIASRFSQPIWNGQTHIEENQAMRPVKIHVHTEQGFGDTLQFCRYVDLAIESGVKVDFEVPKNMVELMHDSFPKANIMPMAVDYPGNRNIPTFDYHVPLMSMPHIFKTTLENIPSSNYLKSNGMNTRRWSHISELPGLKVGICWAGEKRKYDDILVKIDERRSIDYDVFKGIMDVEGVSFVSLQLGEKLEQARGDERLLLPSELTSWADTAGLIENLDLVITVDTAVLHLAAAMGKPTWLLNRYDTCWRWLLDKEDSLWYKSLKIFRQESMGDWKPVISRVRAELGRYSQRQAA